jgi:hypothetical protein
MLLQGTYGLLFPSELKKLHLEELRQLVLTLLLQTKQIRSQLVQVLQLKLQLRLRYDALSSNKRPFGGKSPRMKLFPFLWSG